MLRRQWRLELQVRVDVFAVRYLLNRGRELDRGWLGAIRWELLCCHRGTRAIDSRCRHSRVYARGCGARCRLRYILRESLPTREEVQKSVRDLGVSLGTPYRTRPSVYLGVVYNVETSWTTARSSSQYIYCRPCPILANHLARPIPPRGSASLPRHRASPTCTPFRPSVPPAGSSYREYADPYTLPL